MEQGLTRGQQGANHWKPGGQHRQTGGKHAANKGATLGQQGQLVAANHGVNKAQQGADKWKTGGKQGAGKKINWGLHGAKGPWPKKHQQARPIRSQMGLIRSH